MRTVEVTLYSASELREHHPEGFERALERHRRMVCEDPAWASEIRESLDAALAAIANPPDIDGPTGADDVRRCMAWLENRVLEPLRIPWSGKRRWSVAKYGYRPGHVPPCPWTGVCFDDDLLDTMRTMARDGRNPREWARELRDEADRLLDLEIEHQCSADYFGEDAEANGREFRANGGEP